jgi:multiple sugar transport system permease protein
MTSAVDQPRVAPLATAPVWDDAANERERRKARVRNLASRSVLYVTATMFALFAALPFAWMVLTVFKTNTDLYNPNLNPFLFHDPPTLANITYLFERTEYATFVKNTLIVSVLVVVITLIGAVPAA